MPPVPSAQRDRIRHRKSVVNLTSEQLGALRTAIAEIMPLRDRRGYQWHAAVHGLPEPGLCEHGTRFFLPWHRAYLYFFELAMRDRVYDATVPWWDWRTPAAADSALPDAFAAARVARRPNPLHKAPVEPPGREGNWPRQTSRDPGANTPHLPTPELVEDILDERGFREFTIRVETELHNRAHMWVGGAMTDPRFAAFDPIFWAHHGMVDRLWRIWQLRHPGASYDPRFLRQPLRPWGVTVEQVIDVTRLGYEYAASTSTSPGR